MRSHLCLSHGFFLDIKTTSVVYSRPAIVDSIDDMINLKRGPIIFATDAGIKWFISANKGTPMRRYYDYAIHLRRNDSFIRSKSDVEYRRQLNGILQQKKVYMVFSHDLIWKTATLCSMLRSPESPKDDRDIFTWISREKHENSWTRSIIMRRGVKPVTMDLVQRRLQWMMQASLTTYIDGIFVGNIISMNHHTSDTLLCMSNIIQYPDDDKSSLSLSHYQQLFLLFSLVTVLLPATSLLIELFRRVFVVNLFL